MVGIDGSDGSGQAPVEPGGYKPRPPLWQSDTDTVDRTRVPMVAVVGCAFLFLLAQVLDSPLLASPAVATPATIVAIEGFDPLTDDSSELITYVLKLRDGRQTRLVSPKGHAVGTQLMAMVSTSRLSGRLVASSAYILTPK